MKKFLRKVLGYAFLEVAIFATFGLMIWWSMGDGDPDLWKYLIPTILTSSLMSWLMF